VKSYFFEFIPTSTLHKTFQTLLKLKKQFILTLFQEIWIWCWLVMVKAVIYEGGGGGSDDDNDDDDNNDKTADDGADDEANQDSCAC
jgi:hypothetical protein